MARLVAWLLVLPFWAWCRLRHRRHWATYVAGWQLYCRRCGLLHGWRA